MCDLLANVHENTPLPHKRVNNISIVRGKYHYYHYVCDKFDDRATSVTTARIRDDRFRVFSSCAVRESSIKGWGCGYRTLQTVCSWMKFHVNSAAQVPSLSDIQRILVSMGDKPSDFIGSREWIGSVEVALVIDKLFDVPCKILHVNSGRELKGLAATLFEHFQTRSSPIMMGGDTDASSKGIFGICEDHSAQYYVLVIDPHLVWAEGQGQGVLEKKYLWKNGWVVWQPLDSFVSESFYNLCLPQTN